MRYLRCTGKTQCDEWEESQIIWMGLLKMTHYAIHRGNAADKRDAIAWIDQMSPRLGGFAWCCSLFDTDPVALRKRMIETVPEKKYAPVQGKYIGWVNTYEKLNGRRTYNARSDKNIVQPLRKMCASHRQEPE